MPLRACNPPSDIKLSVVDVGLRVHAHIDNRRHCSALQHATQSNDSHLACSLGCLRNHAVSRSNASRSMGLSAVGFVAEPSLSTDGPAGFCPRHLGLATTLVTLAWRITYHNRRPLWPSTGYAKVYLERISRRYAR